MRAARASVIHGAGLLLHFVTESTAASSTPISDKPSPAATSTSIGDGFLASQLRDRIRDTNWGYKVRLFSESPLPAPER